MNQTLAVARAGARAGRTLLFAALAASAAATPGYSLGEFNGGTLDLNLFGVLMSDSNVFGNLSNEDDIVYTLRPELVFERKGARGMTHFDGGVAVNRYVDFTELNTTDYYLNGKISVPEGKVGSLAGDMGLTFFDGTETDDFVAQRVEIRRFQFDANTKYEISNRTALRFGGSLTSYKVDLRPKSESWALSTGLSLKLRPTISGFIDYAHGQTRADAVPGVAIGADYDTNNIAVGLDGQLSRNLTGTVSAGVEKISSNTGDAGEDENNLLANVALVWTPRRTSTITISGGQESRITSDARAIDVLTATFGIEQVLNASLKANALLTWETFETRGLANSTDDRVVAKLDLVYSVHDKLAFGGGVAHNIRWSYNPLYDIDRTTVNFFGRMTF